MFHLLPHNNVNNNHYHVKDTACFPYSSEVCHRRSSTSG